MREFTTAVQAELAAPESSEDTRRPLHTKVDGTPVTLYPLTSSQLVVVAYALDSGSLMQNAAGILNAFFGMLKTPEQIRPWKQKLWDDQTGAVLETITEVMREAVAEWAGNPTQGSGASSSSPEPTGPASTPQPQPSAQPAPFVSGSTGS